MATKRQLMAILSEAGVTEAQRRELVLEWTDGRTNSVRGLTPGELDTLCIKLTERQWKAQKEMDALRKRVIASLFEYCKLTNRPQTIDYVKAMACQFSSNNDFNKISETKLRACYNFFLEQNKRFKRGLRMTASFHLEAQNYN
ncbi:MAG: hypothetical protein WCJ72_11170 [Chryseobacterium sp.]